MGASYTNYNKLKDVNVSCNIIYDTDISYDYVDDAKIPLGYAIKEYVSQKCVLTSRTVAGKALDANVTASDISSAIGLGNYLKASDFIIPDPDIPDIPDINSVQNMVNKL